MNWREHLRIIALLANGVLVMFLVGSKGWWMPTAFGLPLIVPPALAVVALAVNRSAVMTSSYRP
jgi:hypothetical protein